MSVISFLIAKSDHTWSTIDVHTKQYGVFELDNDGIVDWALTEAPELQGIRQRIGKDIELVAAHSVQLKSDEEDEQHWDNYFDMVGGSARKRPSISTGNG